jgi:hypothetical protein
MANGNIYHVSRLTNPKYWWEELPQDIAENLKKKEIDPLEVWSITSTPELQKGPFDISSTYILEVKKKDEKNNLIRNLFIKKYTPEMMDLIRGRSGFKSIKNVDEFAKYQYDHMKFWNEHGLATPAVFGYEKEESTCNIISDYWEGPTHDIDHIYLSLKLKNYYEQKNNKLLHGEDIKKFDEEIEQLQKIQKDLTIARLDTINEFAIRGTHFINEGKNKGLHVSKPTEKEKVNYNTKKAEDIVKWIMLYNEVINSNLTLDSIIDKDKHNLIEDNIPKKIKQNIYDTQNSIGKIIPILIEDVIDKKNWVYRQGDEYLHHFKQHEFEKDNFKAGILDACKTRMGHISEGKVKTLIHPLLDFNYNDEITLLSNSLSGEIDMRNEFGKSIGYNIERKIDFSEENRIFDKLALFECLKLMGRKAKDALCYSTVHQGFANLSFQYENKNIKDIPKSQIVPEPPVSYEIYRAENFIPIVTDKIKERLEIILNRKTSYSLNEREFTELDNFRKLFYIGGLANIKNLNNIS